MTQPISIDIKRIDHESVIPSQAKDSDAGYDLHAIEGYVLAPLARKLFRTGITIAIPEGYVGYIKPRSGLAAKRGLDVLGGVIDSGYRGDIGAILYNTDKHEPVTIAPGDRIAQLVIHPVASVVWREVLELASSQRGASGFGSSGTGVA